MPEYTYPLNYSLLCFYLLGALDKNQPCSIAAMQQSIQQRDLNNFLVKQGVSPDPSIITDDLQIELQDMINADIDHKFISNAQNGYAILLAYLIELIQRHKPNV